MMAIGYNQLYVCCKDSNVIVLLLLKFKKGKTKLARQFYHPTNI